MVNLAEIRGQPRVVAHLRRALAQDRVAHAYLFCGPSHCGKQATGIALAAALNCMKRTHPSDEPSCGSCASCTKIASGNHPDVQTLERQGAAQIIPIDVIRKQVIPQLATPPHEGRVRVFLIEEANSLQGPSANALLKTLEEPPPRTHFILATTAPDQLLPTIRSRCQRVSFATLTADVEAAIDAAAGATSAAGGAGDDATRIDELASQLFTAIAAHDRASLFSAAAEVGRERKEVPAVLKRLADKLHTEAVAAAHETQLPRAATLSRQAARVLETETAVSLHNAHAQLALEQLLDQLRGLAQRG